MESSREPEPKLLNAYDGSSYSMPSVKEEILAEKKAALEAFNDRAYEDGIITPEEIEKAQELQREIRAIEAGTYVAQNDSGDVMLASFDSLSAADLPIVI